MACGLKALLVRVKPGNALIEHMFSAFAGSGHADGRTCGVEIGRRDVIQACKAGAGILRYELSDDEWAIIGRLLPNKVRGVVDDRRVLNGIFGCYGPVRRGATSRTPSVPTPSATTALCAGDAPGSGAGSWTRSRLPVMPPSK